MAATATVALAVAPATAQTLAERTMLAAWDDSMQHATDLPALDLLDASSSRLPGRVGDLRRALFLIRRGDLSDTRANVELALTNAQVVANHTDWPAPEFVLARGFVVMAGKQWVEALSDGKEFAEKHSDAVWRTLRASLDRDSTFLPARRLLGELTVAQGDRFLRPDQVTALRREARQPDANPDALLAWARHLRTLREYPAALTALSQAIDQGGDRGRLQLELARTTMATHDSANAVSAYWDGLVRLTPIGREMYRFDLAWITDSTTLVEFDQLADSAVSPWLRRFWNSRDAEDGNYPGDRLREHLRRWVVVLERNRALSPWSDAFFTRVELGFEYPPEDGVRLTPNPNAPIKKATCVRLDAAIFDQLWHMQPWHAGDLRTREPLLDQRGLIYLRHGEPQRRIDGGGAAGGGLLGGQIVRQAGPPGVDAGQAHGSRGVLFPWSAAGLGEAPDRPNGPAGESWIYGLSGDWHILQFRGSAALGRYAATTLTQRIPAAWMDDPRVEATIPGMTYVQLTKRIAEEKDSPMRKASPTHPPVDVPTCYTESIAVAAQTRKDEHAFLNRDTDTPAGIRPSNSVVQVFGLGASTDQTGEALVSFAMASEVLRLDRENGRSGYSLAFHVVAYDRAGDRTITVDTVRRFASLQPLVAGQFLTAHLEFALPAGDWHVAARAQQVGGTVAINDARMVHIDGAAPLTLSDIVTGRPGTPDWLATDQLGFPVNYTNGWYPDETAELFFEVRGVPAGESYRTTIAVRPLDPKSKAMIQIGSTDPAVGSVTYVRKSLGLKQLPPGTYTVEVTVEFAGAKAARSRQVLIVPRP